MNKCTCLFHRFHLSVCTTWQNCNQHVRLAERQESSNTSNNNRNENDTSPNNSNNNHVVQTNDRVELVVE